MSAKPEPAETEEAVKAPLKSKKLLLLIVAAVVVLALAGGAAFFFLGKKSDSAEGEAEQEPVAEHVVPRGPPVYLPIENMVVNLADPGGEKVAQIGVTLELSDTKAPEKVKAYLPAIRNGILLLISQRTAEELLQIEGKEKLAAAILADASRHFEPGGAGKPGAGKDGEAENPVRGVLFSSFIVQ